MAPLPPSHRNLLRQKSKIDKSVDAVKSLNQGIKRVSLGKRPPRVDSIRGKDSFRFGPIHSRFGSHACRLWRVARLVCAAIGSGSTIHSILGLSQGTGHPEQFTRQHGHGHSCCWFHQQKEQEQTSRSGPIYLGLTLRVLCDWRNDVLFRQSLSIYAKRDQYRLLWDGRGESVLYLLSQASCAVQRIGRSSLIVQCVDCVQQSRGNCASLLEDSWCLCVPACL
jgi:hypothetical protein